jgi:hypothetical protein
VWTLPQLQSWVYVAVLDVANQDSYNDVVRMARTSGAWSEASGKPDDPYVCRVCGDEFLAALRSLLNWTPCAMDLDDFPVGNWASVARIGTYCGDIGCIIGHRNGGIFVATLVRSCTKEEFVDEGYCPHVMRPPVIGVCDIGDLTENREQIEFGQVQCIHECSGRRRTLTTSGLNVTCYRPWELRMASPDGSPLSLTEWQAEMFRMSLPAHFIASMPLPKEELPRFSAGERVRLNDCPGVLTGHWLSPPMTPSFQHDDESTLWQVYVPKRRSHCYIPVQRLIKEHTFEQVFNIETMENMELLTVDYLRARAKVQIHKTAPVG